LLHWQIILLRSEIPRGMCAKLCTVAASNNRDHPTGSLYYCLFAPHTYIFVLRAHPIHGESYNQRNTTGEVATRMWRSCGVQPSHKERAIGVLCVKAELRPCNLLQYLAGDHNMGASSGHHHLSLHRRVGIVL